jgi:hypothetical protein
MNEEQREIRRKKRVIKYNGVLQKALPSTVWATGGCSSWYIDKTGLPNLYPFLPSQFKQEMKQPDFSEYRLIAAS